MKRITDCNKKTVQNKLSIEQCVFHTTKGDKIEETRYVIVKMTSNTTQLSKYSPSSSSSMPPTASSSSFSSSSFSSSADSSSSKSLSCYNSKTISSVPKQYQTTTGNNAALSNNINKCEKDDLYRKNVKQIW